ncbi:MAG: UDP-N-acetylmuramoyl-tripeptide--D-alanyl-D-alanine ligase, partial [Oscillospiraceae bacterium]
MQVISLKKLLLGVADENRIENMPDTPIDGVVTDSRQGIKGKVFVAIKGEKVDGHDFAKTAIEQGVELVIAKRNIDGVDSQKILVVENVLDTLIQMGKNYRNGFSPRLVGVTGSVGKTTTKEFCAAVFSAFGETLKTAGNQNNEIGMPNTLFKLDDKTQYAIIEMGMQGLGEIEKLTLAAQPEAAIITSVGHSHLAQLKTRENICKAKMEICQGLPKDGILVINGDDDYLPKATLPKGIRRFTFAINAKNADVVAFDIKSKNKGQTFKIKDCKNGEFEVFIPAHGVHNVYNALGAYTLATRMGLNPHKVSVALADYKTTGFRQNEVSCGGFTVIEDCYNANPDSMAAALKMLAEKKCEGKKIAVLGDMLELGEISVKAHYNAGKQAAECGADVVIAIGEKSTEIAKGAKENGVEKVLHFNNNEQAAT